MSGVAPAGSVPVVACPTAAAMLSRLGNAPGGGTGVLVAADGTVTVATMTPFGPSLHVLPRKGAGAAASVLCEAARRGQAAYLHAPAEGTSGEVFALVGAAGLPSASEPGEVADDADDAARAFRSRRPAVPVTRTADGGARSRGWSVAPYDPAVPVAHGLRLALRAEPSGDGLALRWRNPDGGADMGLHAVLPRAALTRAEAALVDGAWAEVVSYAYGLSRLPDGTQGRTVVLVLDVPRGIDTGFPDGARPVGGAPP